MKNKKTIFEVLNEMNIEDIKNGTKLVSLHPDLIAIEQTKKGTKVTMGVPNGIVDISAINFLKTQRVVLLVVDGVEFDKRMKV